MVLEECRIMHRSRIVIWICTHVLQFHYKWKIAIAHSIEVIKIELFSPSQPCCILGCQNTTKIAQLQLQSISKVFIFKSVRV
jgi:hypothetical protein